ncbi:MAG: hypothetical protein FJX77_07145 [Armatimonadetes bacterium]|nr:hypothetical protein [Armatimonadota bacterium]
MLAALRERLGELKGWPVGIVRAGDAAYFTARVYANVAVQAGVGEDTTGTDGDSEAPGGP